MKRRKPVEELRALIDAAGLNQRTTAEALGKTQRTIEYWLSGQQDVPRMAILAMRRIAEHGLEPE